MYHSLMNKLKNFIIKFFLLSCLILGLAPNQSYAIGLFGGLSVSDSVGTSSFSTDTDKPKVNILNIGASFGGQFFGFLLVGARSSISKIFQTSEPATSTGNRRGTRTVPVAPLVGLDFSFMRLQADYQINGDYIFSNYTTTNLPIVYKKPTGMGVELMFKASPWIGLGIRYEKVDFKEEQIGSAAATTLTNKLNLKSYGAMINVYF